MNAIINKLNEVASEDFNSLSKAIEEYIKNGGEWLNNRFNRGSGSSGEYHFNFSNDDNRGDNFIGFWKLTDREKNDAFIKIDFTYPSSGIDVTINSIEVLNTVPYESNPQIRAGGYTTTNTLYIFWTGHQITGGCDGLTFKNP